MRNALSATLIAVLFATILPAEITFDSSYECGNGTGFKLVAPNTYEFQLEIDTNSDDSQWFDFSVAGASGQTLTFSLTNAGSANVRNHWHHANPVTSTDGGKTWELAKVNDDYTSGVYKFTMPITADPQRITFHYPYSFSYYKERLAKWKESPYVKHEVIGKSVQGREIDLLTITGKEGTDKLGVWVTARQHAAEVTGSFMADGFIEFLLSDDPVAAKLRERLVVNIVPMCNPDGVVIGNYRDNAMGMNLNRSWRDATLEKDPEIVHVLNAIDKWVKAGKNYTLFVDMHSTSGARNNFAFHAAEGIKPAKYPTPETYAADTDRLLNLVQKYSSDFDPGDGDSKSPDTRLSRQNQMEAYGIMAVLFEGTYNDTSYGEHEGEFMTPERHRNIGVALAKAINDYYFPGE